MLTAERIELGLAGEDVAPEMAVAAGTEEERRRGAPWWRNLRIEGGLRLLVR